MHEFLTSTSQESWGAGGRGEEALCDLHVSTVFQRALASIIERKIMLMSDACSRPPICIRSHNLHGGNIKGAVGEITSYHMRGITSLPFSFLFLRVVRLLTFLWPSIVVSPVMVLAINILFIFFLVFLKRKFRLI